MRKGRKRKSETKLAPKISMLELLRLCKKYGGVDYDSINKIAKETNIHRKTIVRYIDQYCIILNLHAGLLDD